MAVRRYYVYILASNSGTLYIGVTHDLIARVLKHREWNPKAFTSRYKVHKLVYYESFGDVYAAIAREKQLKTWRREKKLALIQEHNPQMLDLYPDHARDVLGV